jgi:hypothetical protein
MVYLGPITPRPEPLKTPVRPSKVTAVTAYASEARSVSVTAAPVVGVGPPGGIERRKQDRRSKSGEPFVETRGGKDRRRSTHVSVNVII